MEDNIDKLLSTAFEYDGKINSDSALTKRIMQELHHRGVSYKTKVFVLSLSLFLGLFIALSDYRTEELFAMQQELFAEGLWSVQYWLAQLVSLA